MSEVTPAKSTRTVVTQQLSKAQRVCAGLGGGVMTGLAGYAVVVGNDGATSVAFVAAGGGSLLIALLGYLPLRIKYKDTEIDLRREVQEVIDPIAGGMNEAELQKTVQEIASASDFSSVAANAAASRVYEHIGFERTVINSLESALGDGGWIIERQTDTAFDAVVRRVGTAAPVFIDVKLRFAVVGASRSLDMARSLGGNYLVFVQDLSNLKGVNFSNVLAREKNRIGRGRRVMIAEFNRSTAIQFVEYMASEQVTLHDLDNEARYLLITDHGIVDSL